MESNDSRSEREGPPNSEIMEAEETTGDPKNKDTSNNEAITDTNKPSNKEEEMEEDEEKTDNSERSLFKLVVVNSYGSQEVKKLEPSESCNLSSEHL